MLLDFLHPNILALLSATFISIARVAQRYAVVRMSALFANLVMAIVTALFGWIFYSVDIPALNITFEGVFWFMAVGFFGAFAGRYFNLISLSLTGLARAAIVAQTVLIWSALFAVFGLGEEMTLPIALGTTFIMFSSMLIVYDGKSSGKRKIPVYYYLVPALSALMYAFAHLTGKIAFSLISSSSFGMAISNTTSLSLLVFMIPFQKSGKLKEWDKKGFLMLLFGAVFQSFGILCFWSAMKLGKITQIIPLSRLSLLLIVFLTWYFFREQEKLTYRVFIGAVLALVGAYGVVYGR
ncbi:MAG: EamA family transporter [Nitrospinota bacterium]|nr:EamA family transporter [Nitrospinota bacterium]